MKKPVISVVIATYNKSFKSLEIPLKSLAKQKCPKGLYEVIIVDNRGGERVKFLAKQYNVKLIEVGGKPSQLCSQINKGAEVARGEYILIQDHDIEIDKNLIGNFIEMANRRGQNIDAWYIPYKIIANSRLLQKMRNFEEWFYKDSIIAAPRMIKKNIFSKIQWDQRLSAGAPDWDFTIQMKLIGAKFGYLKNYFYHHEEQMSFWEFVNKKTIYSKGGELYQNKWRNINPQIYKSIVVKQYNPYYRLFGIFVENGKWRKLLTNIHMYILFLIVKILISVIYFYHLNKHKSFL